MTRGRRWDGRRCAREGGSLWVGRFSWGSVGGGGYLLFSQPISSYGRINIKRVRENLQ